VTGWFRYAYIGSLVLFLAGLVFQVYLVGQSLFVDPRDWAAHSSWVMASTARTLAGTTVL